MQQINEDIFATTISNIISRYNKTLDESIMKYLERYDLVTGDKQIWDFLRKKYPNLFIKYSKYLDSSEHKLYLISKDSLNDWLQPITLNYEPVQLEFDPISYTMKGNCKVSLSAGGSNI